MRSIITILKVGLAVAAVALVGVLACSKSDAEQPEREVDKSNFAWHDLDKWQGEGNFESPAFHISSDEWRILFVAKPDAKRGGDLAIRLYTAEGVLLEDLFNTNVQAKGTLQNQIQGAIGVSGRGDFLLTVITSRPFQMTLQEFR